ncbi:Gx transporter family protein [Pleomorphochaeta sp. DL1XJH-081]|uniref:Gx transporter family protein n=1 Tax=Pleomorphochaeta sp. DL1XJH-081 TaxID=3409690 RepID=UPI003BB768AD
MISHSETHTHARVEFVALLAAFALFLSTVEYMIPKPVPFMRIGLANLPLLIGLGILNNREYILLALLKVLGQGLITGTIFSYIALFSLGGTISSAFVMFVMFRYGKHWISLLGISMAGAMASNITQLQLSRAILFGDAARLIAPPFLIVGLATSIILGIFAQRFVDHSAWYKRTLEAKK